MSHVWKLNYLKIHKYILTCRSHLIDACANKQTIFSDKMCVDEENQRSVANDEIKSNSPI